SEQELRPESGRSPPPSRCVATWPYRGHPAPNGAGTRRSGMAEEQTAHVPPTPGGDVFISYASHDKAVSETVCKALEGAGLVCWMAPRDVVPGESFAGAIVHAIDGTQVVV